MEYTDKNICSDTTTYLLSSEANRERLMESIEQMNRLKQSIQKQDNRQDEGNKEE